MYDLSTKTEKTICTNPGAQSYPVIYKEKIVWMDNRNGNWDIYMYDISTNTEKPVCTNPAAQCYPSIYENKIVWQDRRNGNWDIYMYENIRN